ncbi:MAG TPA: iron-containing alcohol dehydrogenase, partial [Methanosarcina sp.]
MYNMYIPTRTLFGAGQLNNLHIQRMPGKKAMVVISNGKSARKNGYLARTEEQLKLAGIETVVFDNVEANPLKSTIMAGGTFAKENSCDFIVALGG